jgi:hypothetical protein
VCSSDLTVPESLRGTVSAYAIEQLRIRTGQVGFVWIDPQEMAGWCCSWG